MNIERTIPLDRILPNPWQPRESEDAEHIKNLAMDIVAHGLLQKPVGRVVDGLYHPITDWTDTADGEWSVQLAFGHSRLEAYRWLNDVQNISNLAGDWSSMPVIIQELTDEQMFEMALSENLQRRDLTPIEVAKAMARYRDEFGKSSVQIGEVFGMSDSAVRNKIRLLTLPEDVQKAMVGNGISERAARALLTLFDLPADVRERAEQTCWQDKPSEIVRQTLNGVPSDSVTEKIDRMVRSVGQAMYSALFKHSDRFEGDYRSPDCKSCSLRIIQKENVFCMDGTCYLRKQTACRLAYLTQTSDACGIPVGDASLDQTYSLEVLYNTEQTRKIMGIGCENLRLAWSSDSAGLIKGFPHAEVYCKKNKGRCTCQRALNSGVLPEAILPARAETGDTRGGKSLVEVFEGGQDEPQAVEEPKAEPKQLTAEDLKEIDREVRRKRRQTLEECKAIREDATQKIYFGLVEHNPIIWLEVVKNLISWNTRDKIGEPPFDELMRILAENMAVRIYDWQYGEPNETTALAAYNGLFKHAALPALSRVSAGTEDHDVVES